VLSPRLMAEALELRDKANMVFSAFGDELSDLVFAAGVGCPQPGVRVVFITVIDFRYDYVDTNIRQAACYFGQLLGFVVGGHKHVQAPPWLRLFCGKRTRGEQNGQTAHKRDIEQ
jgi:hypothetical protein